MTNSFFTNPAGERAKLKAHLVSETRRDTWANKGGRPFFNTLKNNGATTGEVVRADIINRRDLRGESDE